MRRNDPRCAAELRQSLVIRIEPFQAEPPRPNAPCITERRRDFDAILQNNWSLQPRAELAKFSIYRIAKLTPGHCLTRSEPPDLPKMGDDMNHSVAQALWT
jgi:hypothetical protein